MADDRIDVSIAVTSSEAEQGADRAAGAITGAAKGIEDRLDSLIGVSDKASQAMAQGFAGMAASIERAMAAVGAAMQANAKIVDDFGNEVEGTSRRIRQANDEASRSNDELGHSAGRAGHSAAAARRELVVLGHEMLMGNYTRLTGSLMVLAETMDWLGAIMSPVGIGIAAIGGAAAIAGLSAMQGANQMSELRNSLILTGNYAGITAGQFMEMGNEIAGDTGQKITTVRDALAAVAATGRFTGQALQPVTEAVVSVARFSDESAADIVKAFERISEGVYKWAVEYNQSAHFATAAQLEHIRVLEESGQKEQAEVEAANLVVQKNNEMAASLGYLPSLWHELGEEIAKARDAMMNWGRPDTIDDQIAHLRKGIADAKKDGADLVNVGPFKFAPVADAEQQLQDALRRRDAGRANAAKQANDENVQATGTSADEWLAQREKGWGGSKEQADDAVNELRNRIAADKAAADASARRAGTEIGSNYSKALKDALANQSKYEDEIRKSYDKQDFKGQPTVGNEYTLQNAQTQANLATLRESSKEQTDELERAHRANEVDLRTYYARRLKITQDGLTAEAGAVQQQIDQTKALEGRAQTPAQRMSLQAHGAELQGRLDVLNMQNAAAPRQSAQEQSQAEQQQQRQLDQLAARRAQTDMQAQDERSLMVAQRQVQQGQMTNQQLLAMEAQFDQRETAQQIQALQQRLQTERDLSVEARQQINDQIAQLQQQSQTKQLQLAMQMNDDQVQSAQQAADAIEQGFARSFADFADGAQTGRTAFARFITGVNQQMTQLVSSNLFKQLFQMPFGQGQGSSLGGLISRGTSYLFGTSQGAAGSTSTAAHTAAVTADTTGLTAMTAAIAAATAALMQLAVAAGSSGSGAGVSGISGMFGSLGNLFGVGTGGSNAYGFTMPDGSAGDIMPADLGGNAFGFTMPDLPSFDVGTPYVPNDMVAQIHQGEKIVPAHLNSSNSNVSVVNQFALPGSTDLRTQSQIASMAGMAIQSAVRRNG
ncbi:phage tail length tape measure family protein [Paraburkholderia caballeronis]|uniref:phage tail length tape measure family protein n=1 Tax=Paraburkholderia caballeronis TaxID=416943 RepID=UPI001065E1AC|nr:phage tail length tape measure family protein [Paraburkholderia caballeronis]TDV04690.1 tail length tape measure protein [Paraburkholderia caballeronis]TDV07933.1 tail length tape measure protein [Paraburkholderia caballeronis]TDV18224.1 tail length tape measure protein [Paraburkholderia caballeronis]